MTSAAPTVRIGRRRRACGWTLAALGLVLGAASVWSRGRDVTVGAEGHGYVWSVTLTSGVVQWSLQHGAIDTYHFGGGWEIGKPPSDGAWVASSSYTAVQPEWRVWGWVWTLVNQRGGWHRFAATPVWPFALAALAGGTLCVRSAAAAQQRARSGVCPTCGYDRRGLGAAVVCPECGKKARA